MQIGDCIKFWRETRNYTEMHMASELGISQSAYSKLESGKIKLDAERLFRISVILQVSLDELSPHADNLHSHANSNKASNLTQGHEKPDFFASHERELYQKLITEKEKLIIEKQETISILKEMLAYFRVTRKVS